MAGIAVVYHSGYGHTKKQAEAVAKGAGAELLAVDAEGNLTEQQWAALDSADAIIMGSPTYMGSVSWQFKKFADASSKAWFTQKWKDKIFAGFTNSATMNDDKLSTLHYLFTLAMQHSGIWGGTGLMPSNSKAAQRNDVNYVGSFSGAMMQSPSDASAEEVIRATWRRRGCSASASPQSRSSCVAKRLRVTARPRFHAAGTVEVIDEPDHFDDSLRQA